MKLGVFSTFLPEYTFPEACALIKSLGYSGVQPRLILETNTFDAKRGFNPWGNNKGGISETTFFADPKAAMKPAEDAGLEITSVASYTSVADMDRAVKMVKACGSIGIRNVRIAALPLPKDPIFDYNKLMDESRGLYKELVAEAKEAGVRPCLELHMGTPCPSPSGAIAFLQGFSPEDVGILYDPANMISDGWERVGLSLNILGPYLAEVHVKNSRWEFTAKEEDGVKIWRAGPAPLDDGCVNWPDVIKKLKLHNYDGWLIEEGHLAGVSSFERLKSAYELLSELI